MINRNALKIRYRKGLEQCRRWHRSVATLYGWREFSRRDIGIAGTTRVPCSCAMCGNPRRNFKGKDALTLQERKAALMEKDE